MSAALMVFWFVAGLLAGAVYFGALWRSVQSLTQGGTMKSLLWAAFLRLGLLFAALALIMLTGQDGYTILALMLGFLAARLIATRWARRSPGEG